MSPLKEVGFINESAEIIVLMRPSFYNSHKRL